MAFDARGRLFVAENRGYPIGPKEGEAGAGVVALLEDTDRDGRMDRRTVFAEGLSFPNGVIPWKDGVIVTCAPDVLFLRDSRGTGHADEKRVLLTGFATTGSTQLRVNCPTVGPDGWIYLAAGLSGGTITSPEHPERAPLKMTGDVRFHPETLEVQSIDGRSQYGMSFDEEGRRFICMNRLPVQQVVLSSDWLRRNPRLTFSETVQDCNERSVKSVLGGGSFGVRLFPISANITTADSHAGSFSAACGIHVWKGVGLPPAYRGAALSCDPTGNLVHADRLVPNGAALAAEPLIAGREMLASRDDWFRPVFLAQGPGGALYIADMYRRTIEHPDYLPEEVRRHTDFESGKNLGRIWRVISSQASSASVPERGRQGDGGDNRDRHQSEGAQGEKGGKGQAWLRAPLPEDPSGRAAWSAERLAAARSSDPQVRFHAALALGNLATSESTAALAAIAVRDGEDRWTRAAILSGVAGRETDLLRAYLHTAPQMPGSGAQEFLSFLGGAIPDLASVGTLVSGDAAAQFPLVLPVLLGFTEKQSLPSGTALPAWAGDLLKKASAIAADVESPIPNRTTAIRLLGRASTEEARAVLERLALSEPQEALRAAAIGAWARVEQPAVTKSLLEPWQRASPAVRDATLTALLSSSFHTGGILDAIESGSLPASALSGLRRRQILKHRDAVLRTRAEKLFAAAPGGRQKAFEEAKAVLQLVPQPAHGREVFKAACASCHRLEREGFTVGPDLLDIRNQPKENILFHIVVPDAEIAPAFTAYVVETRDGRSLGGIVASETPSAVTLRGPMAADTSVLRADIVRMEAFPGSLMPTGLEAAMSPQDLADLLAFLKGEQ